MHTPLIPRIGLCLLLLGPACTQRNAVTLDSGTQPTADGTQPTADDGQPALDGAPVSCTSNAECGPALYCHREGCGGTGACRPRPTLCPDYDTCPWACGCDGNNYCMACEAQQAGVNVRHEGTCMSCGEIDAAYQAEVVKAKQNCCATCAAPQCTQQVNDRLACGCPTAINDWPGPEMMSLEQTWYQLGCTAKLKCSPATCLPLKGGSCASDGFCDDVF